MRIRGSTPEAPRQAGSLGAVSDRSPFAASSERKDDEIWVIEASGELDIATAPRLQVAIDEVLGSQPGKVLLELRDVSFLDLSGIRVLVDARNALEQQGAALVIDGMSGAVSQVLETAGLLTSLTEGDA